MFPIKRRILIAVAVFAFYAVVAVLMTWPLVTVLTERMIGHPFGDSYEYSSLIWWMNHALRTGQSPFFQPLLLYPRGLDAPLLWSIPLQSFPAWLLMFVMPLPAAFNLSALLTLALNGWSMWFLSGQLLKDKRLFEPPRRQERQEETSSLITHYSFFSPSLLAGLVFMLYPAFQGQLGAGHTGLLVLWTVPLLVATLARLSSQPLTPDPFPTQAGRGEKPNKFLLILAAAVLFMMSSWGSILLLMYVVAPVTGVIVVSLLWQRRGRALLRVIAALVLGTVFSLPFWLPTLSEQISQPAALREDGSVLYSSSLLGIVSPSFYHPLFTSLDYPHRVLGVDPFEGASYVGIIAAALALIAVWKIGRARGWLVLATIAWIFSLGPLLKLFEAPVMLRVAGYMTHISLPWALFQNLPLLSIARTPARFNFAVGFAVAVMVGYGAAFLWTRMKSRLRQVVLVVLMALVIFEYQWFWGMPTVPAGIPAPIAALGEQGNIRAVFDVPWDHLLTDKEAMYLQTGHGLPLIAGHIARRTPLDPAVRYLLQRTLDPALLDAAGADVIILHRDWDDEAGITEATLRERFGSPSYEDERFAVFRVPSYTGEAAGFVVSAELPAEISDQASLYFYAPQPGTVTLTGQVSAEGARRARLLMDGMSILEWTVQGQLGLDVPIEIGTAGYHTLTIAIEPACPAMSDPTVRCNPLRVTGIRLEGYIVHIT